MSMKEKRFSRIPAIFVVIFIFAAAAFAQQIEANIKIESVSPPVVCVEGKFFGEYTKKNWGFLRSIAGIENLGERISDFTLTDKNGKTIATKKLIAGEYLAEESATNFSYKVDLTAPKNLSAMAHVSWIDNEKGLLMLDDLMPQFGLQVSAKINFELPQDWQITGEGISTDTKSVVLVDIEKAIFFVGKKFSRSLAVSERWRNTNRLSYKFAVNIAISGEWLFSTDEAKDVSTEVIEEYEKLFGEFPANDMQIFLVKFPAGTRAGNWEAETRGSSVVILSSDMPFKTQSVQRLHEQFRHEFFHLWIPNNLALAGNYDWFYEGFALYQSLRTGVALNRIRFEDFLDTLGRAYDLDNMQTQKISLIEASKNRWNGANNLVYARGMLVAFLCDVALLRESKGKRSVADVLLALYQKHRKPNNLQDANAAIINLLTTYAELRPIVERYIKGAEKLAWQTDLESIGIETNGENFPSKLTVKAKLKGREKDLLNELGYNNWRKLSR
jgi:hypothetical protein